MKKIISLFLFCLFMAQMCFAQDIIITRDSKRIDAKVEEISDTEVRYHRQDNPTGPIFVIKTSQLSSIVFSNGAVQTFEVEEDNGNVNAEEEDGKQVIFASGRTILYKSGEKMEYHDGAFYYGGMRLGDDEYGSFLQQICPDAYGKYQARIGWDIVGDIFFYSGSFGIGWSLGSLIWDDSPSEIYADGILLMWSVLDVLVSIPFFAAKNACKRKSTEIFNNQCSIPQRKQSLSLSFNITPVSAGLTLNF